MQKVEVNTVVEDMLERFDSGKEMDATLLVIDSVYIPKGEQREDYNVLPSDIPPMELRCIHSENENVIKSQTFTLIKQGEMPFIVKQTLIVGKSGSGGFNREYWNAAPCPIPNEFFKVWSGEGVLLG